MSHDLNKCICEKCMPFPRDSRRVNLICRLTESQQWHRDMMKACIKESVSVGQSHYACNIPCNPVPNLPSVGELNKIVNENLLQSQLDKLENSNAQQFKLIEELSMTLAKKERLIESLAKDVAKLDQILCNSVSNIMTINKRLHNLETATSVSTQYSLPLDRLRVLEAKFVDLESDTKELRDSIKITDDIEERNCQELKDAIEELEGKVKNHSNDLDKLQDSITRTDEWVSGVEDDVREAKEELEVKINDMANSEGLSSDAPHIKHRLNLIESQCKRIEESIFQTDNTAEELASTVEDLRSEMETTDELHNMHTSSFHNYKLEQKLRFDGVATTFREANTARAHFISDLNKTLFRLESTVERLDKEARDRFKQIAYIACDKCRGMFDTSKCKNCHGRERVVSL